MSETTYTIGELSRLTGVSVRRLRFYSDEGLLPPTGRTGSGYRMYAAADLARLDLILALREAGVSLDDIGKLLSRRLALGDVLRLRLDALDAEIRAKRRIACVLRAALAADSPTHHDLRRLWTVTSLSHAEFRTAVERFYDQAAGDLPIDPAWRRQMIDAATPDLPDDPTPAQIDAWTELQAMLADTRYVEAVKAGMAQMWDGAFDAAAYAAASEATFARVREAMTAGEAPQSNTGRTIAQDWLQRSAAAMKRTPDAAFLDWQLSQYRTHHARSARYQELLAILRGDDAADPPGAEWRWIVAAMGHLLARNS
ncbi:MerR family transcriptional regulator [Bradyrhizobium sp. U87765 SZCCT0131]|uniref:MerR family transcriptional regulator n=1 Tax=unclassified Bradyrhizobium TaxID=2631580 RepID=UPI001BADE8FA|nr:MULTISPECIES: MerR family transcriptional regulator [unclassified Bradyrhizobium]MBR1222126.1 MerR family transcriptional regulator [Bradyrhizobium sp. U87765 SZCCT0131]MBR1263676.1 MerR family transcriptional regulator [Bradyrhizobium sp. U87765 SZCCT0134]MBR1302754.1 MerR family transcriptional regulator [Bradyrhizobium sp. U87765 SZCCT0110]MBR1319926.1 MerR family transcriptional regulator [Bradyrhizobium sp. U87765 SZCCT0109]MBR1348961.1 MerR family transcriptional regulator [Bradyrhizo